MPIYEFQCDVCGARFERLVDAGAEGGRCPACGAEQTRRVYSALAPPPHLVKTPAENRKQEARNAQLHAAAKARFKEQRRRVREARSRPRGAS